eukprot:1896839-Alexandrium_andersonii.AAC.1
MLLVAAAASAWMGWTGYPGALLQLDGRGVSVAKSVRDFAGQGQVALRIVPRDQAGGKCKKCKEEEQPELSPSPDAREEVVDRPYTYKEVV